MTRIGTVTTSYAKKLFKNYFISAYDDFYYVQGLRIGAFDYIEKPISYNLLFRNFKESVRQMLLNKANDYRRTYPGIALHSYRIFFRFNPQYARRRGISSCTKSYYLDLNLDYRRYVCTVTRIENATD